MEKLYAHFAPYRAAPDDRHLDVLDGVRAICVLLVGWYHIWQQGWLSPTLRIGNRLLSLDFLLRSGYIWVDGLLLLSGFVLYLPYARQKSAPNISAFYRRRLVRILPSYLLCIGVLFALALIRGDYASPKAAALDLAAHLTFTHTLFPFSYHATPLNGALWTLGVEMQFYWLFPLLARLFRRWPRLTYAAMTAAAFAVRAYAAARPDSSMYFNQLPAFLDVYAAGFAGAAAFCALRGRLEKPDRKIALFFTAVFVVCVLQLIRMCEAQAGISGYENIRRGQMNQRFLFSAVLCCAMVSAAFSLPLLRYLLGNPLMRFFSTISFQFYIYHQLFAVQLKKWRFPPSASQEPWRAGDYGWQVRYTLLAFLGAAVIAALITFLFERPLARRLSARRGRKK